MQLNQTAHQSETDAEPVVRAVRNRADLREQLEYPRQMLGGDANTAVLHREDQNLLRFDRGFDLNAAVVLAVPACVVDQVRNHLGEPHGVALEIDIAGRQRQ